MIFDYRKLLGKIVEIFGKQYVFANAIGWSERTCSLKLSSKVEWKQSEIIKACKLLNIHEYEIPTYFYAIKVLL